MNEIKINGRTLYPLTIIMDRYSGSYSGGTYIAWNHEPRDIPIEIFGEDGDATGEWWRFRNSDFYKERYRYGTGNTIAEAICSLAEDIEKRGFAPDVTNFAVVVRCRDCKHRPVEVEGVYGIKCRAPDDGEDICPCLCDEPSYSYIPEDNFFCAKGERKRTRNE